MKILLVAMLGSLLASAADRELSGRVVDEATGEPIARAHVTVHFFQGPQPSPEVTLVTDGDGMFRITNLPEGSYQVVCDKPGYLSNNAGMQGMPVGPHGGAKPAPIVVKLTAQAAIEGTVIDERGAPAAGVYLQLMRQQVVYGRQQWQNVQGGNTDETGAFRIFKLPAGRYYVHIAARLSGVRRTKPLAYPSLYYPNATDISAAQPVDLKAGDEAEIKVRLPEPVPSYEVRGVVPAAGQYIGATLIRQGGYSYPSGDFTWDPKTKAFKFTHVTPGIYTLQVFLPQEGKPQLTERTTITVESADVTGIRLDPGDMNLDGTLRFEGDAPQQKMSGFVAVRSDSYSNSGQVDAEGKFHIPIQPGTYQITPQINSQQACVSSILLSGQDVRDRLTVGDGGPAGAIEVVMTNHCGSVDVSLAPSGSPLPANLTAYLLRRSGDELLLERQGYQAPRAGDSALHFMVPGVAPGDYVVYVWPVDLQVEYANAEYMKQFESYGQKVTVTEDGKATVSLDKALTSLTKN